MGEVAALSAELHSKSDNKYYVAFDVARLLTGTARVVGPTIQPLSFRPSSAVANNDDRCWFGGLWQVIHGYFAEAGDRS